MVAAYVCGTAVYISGVRCTGSLIPLLLGAIFGKCVREGITFSAIIDKSFESSFRQN